MLDVEFLLANKNALKYSILYEYDTMVFKSDVCIKINKYFEFRGFSIEEADYILLLNSMGSVSLFGNYLILIDLNKLIENNPKDWRKIFDECSEKVINKVFNNRFLFLVKTGDDLIKLKALPSYVDLEKNSYHLVESEVNKHSILKIIDFLLIKNKNLIDYNKLENKEPFIKSLERYLEYPEHNLLNFVKFFEEVIIYCIKDNVFNLSNFNLLFQNREEKDYYQLYKVMYNFILNPSEMTKINYFNFISNLYLKRKYSVQLILYRLMKVMKELIYLCKYLGDSEDFLSTLKDYKKYMIKNFDSLPIKSLFKYFILFGRYESSFNVGDFLFEFDRFLNSYLI